jgi:hypothetical protein
MTSVKPVKPMKVAPVTAAWFRRQFVTAGELVGDGDRPVPFRT